MSANTMSISDPSAGGALAPELAKGTGGTPAWEMVSATMAAPPDPTVIAKLTNELFAALPGNPAPPAAALPPSPSSVSAVGGAGSLPGAPQGPGLESPAETDPRALPASTMSVAALAPANPGAVPAQGAPGSPATAFDGARLPFLNAAPVFPATGELFSLLSVPGVQPPPDIPSPRSFPSPAQPTEAELRALPASLGDATALVPGPSGTEPPPVGPGLSAYFVDAQKAAPLTAQPAFPPAVNLFTFPEVPGAQLLPAVPAQPSPPPNTLPAEADLQARATSPAVTTGLVPETSAAVPSRAPESPAYFHEAGKAVPFNAAPSFPATSEIFTLPGVPGVQSFPGIPALPSSPPAAPPTEADVRAGLASVPGATAVASEAPITAASTTAVLGSPAYQVGGEKAAPPTTTHSLELGPEMVPDVGVSKRPFDPHLIRRDFPILQERVHGRPLVWLDNAATTQKPNAVIERLSSFYRHENSNVHRASHTLAARATDAYEGAREKVRHFLNASSTREIVFVRGTTEGINLVAQAWGRRYVEKGDEVVITWLEHHSNIVPWQQLCADKSACLRVAPVDDSGQIMLDQYEKLLGPRTRIVGFSHVSNALGTITPAREMVEIAHRHGARVLIDGAQSVAHMREDMQALDCDFFVFSGHKIFAPTGIGVVYGKVDILDTTPPWQGGGSMITDVTFEKTAFQPAPKRYEAGTGNIADAVGLGAALDYLSEVGIENVTHHEHELLAYATKGLNTVPGLRIIGTAREKASVISFVLDDVRAEDVGVALNQEGIAVRAGHHCAQPVLRRFGLEATVRPSLALYNTFEDIDALVAALLRIQAGGGHRKLQL
jgi:cysteine desulfurase / selenocysteine lyase